MNTTGMSLADELKLLSQVSADQQTARVSRAIVLSLRRELTQADMATQFIVGQILAN